MKRHDLKLAYMPEYKRLRRRELIELLAARTEEGSMISDPDDEEIRRRRETGLRAGAAWVARHRGRMP